MLDLTAIEARVLGSLVEKSRTTPDYYPMTLNALTAACNQSTNRDPVTEFTEDEVEQAARTLRERRLVRSVRTSRSRIMKHQHDLEGVLVIDSHAAALLAVLLLRGPQTAGELRTRTDRYEAFDSLSEVEAALRRLAEDDPPLIRRLDRRAGQKEARWAQLLTDDGDTASPSQRSQDAAAAQRPDPGRVELAPPDDLADRVEALERRVTELETALGLEN